MGNLKTPFLIQALINLSFPFQICSLMRGGIAERGGVRVGHRIIEINGQSVVATPHEKIVHILSNAVGEVRADNVPRKYSIVQLFISNSQWKPTGFPQVVYLKGLYWDQYFLLSSS